MLQCMHLCIYIVHVQDVDQKYFWAGIKLHTAREFFAHMDTSPVYNGHLREPVALPPFAERLAVELSPVLTT